MFVGLASVLTEGLAPVNDQINDVAFSDMFVKSVQVPGQMWLGALNNAVGIWFDNGA